MQTGGSTGLCGSGFDSQLTQLLFGHSGTGYQAFAAGGVVFLGPGGQGGVVRSLADPESMVGASFDQLKAMIPSDWVTAPLSKGAGFRFLAPGGSNLGSKGFIEYNAGAPEVGEALHAGPYMRFSVGGLQYRAALEGNGALGDPDIPDLQIMGSGNTGVFDFSQEFGFGDSGDGGGGE